MTERVREVFERAGYGEVYTPALEYERTFDARQHAREPPRVPDVRRAGPRARAPLGHDGPDRAAGRDPLPGRRAAAALLLLRPRLSRRAPAARPVARVPPGRGRADRRARARGDGGGPDGAVRRRSTRPGSRPTESASATPRCIPTLLDGLGGRPRPARADPHRARRRRLRRPRARDRRRWASTPPPPSCCCARRRPEAVPRCSRISRDRFTPRSPGCARSTRCSRRNVAERIIFDLGLVRSLGYYTGAVFQVYDPAYGVPIGIGGRYDELLGQFGRPLPAVGFALNVERLHIALTGEERGRGRRP